MTDTIAKRGRGMRREEILGAATRLFAERGYEGTSMGDLAEVVGLRKASLFHHFASKDVLYSTVLSNLLEEVFRAISYALTAEGSIESRLDGLSDAMVAALSSNPFAARLLIREIMDEGLVYKDRLGPQVKNVVDALSGVLTLAQESGAIKKNVDVQHVLLSVIGIHFMPFVVGGITKHVTGSEPFDAAFVVARRTAVKTHIRALCGT